MNYRQSTEQPLESMDVVSLSGSLASCIEIVSLFVMARISIVCIRKALIRYAPTGPSRLQDIAGVRVCFGDRIYVRHTLVEASVSADSGHLSGGVELCIDGACDDLYGAGRAGFACDFGIDGRCAGVGIDDRHVRGRAAVYGWKRSAMAALAARYLRVFGGVLQHGSHAECGALHRRGCGGDCNHPAFYGASAVPGIDAFDAADDTPTLWRFTDDFGLYQPAGGLASVPV